MEILDVQFNVILRQGGRKLSRDGYAEAKNPGALAYIIAKFFGGAKKNFCWGREYVYHFKGYFFVAFLCSTFFDHKWLLSEMASHSTAITKLPKLVEIGKQIAGYYANLHWRLQQNFIS